MPMRKWMSAIVLAGLVATAGAAAAIAKQGPKQEVIETKAEKGRGGEDPNVKSATRVNDPKAPEPPAPAAKGGEKPRGQISTCDVHVDNRTPWYIQIYVDGNYSGMMSPYGDLYTRAIAGPTLLYARATFTDGSVLTWGPRKVPCPAWTEYTWKLTR
jgi:hypothetical protein